MPQVTLTNILSVGDFENAGWSGGAYDSSIKKYGSYSLKITANVGASETLVNTQAGYPLIQGHLYYARYEHYHSSAQGTCGIYWPIAEPNFIEGQPLGSTGTWNMCSAVSNRNSFGSSNYQFRIDFNNVYTAGTIWVDGAMLIDLTACFGSGNEPDKTFCDALPFFTGTMLYPPISARAKVDGEWKNVSSIYQKRGGGMVFRKHR